MKQKCVITNYIPKSTPNNVYFNKWFEYHKKDLINLYEIFKENIIMRFPHLEKEKWNNVLFTKFVYFIFNNSSKSI